MSQDTLKITVIGDSLGMERPQHLGDVAKEVTWPVLLEKMLFKETRRPVALTALCERARTMDSVPQAVDQAIAQGSELIIVQVGIVDSAPRIFSRKDREIFNELSPQLRDALLDLIHEHRQSILEKTPAVVYLPLDAYAANAMKAARSAQTHGARVVFVSTALGPDMGLKNPDSPANKEAYNMALRKVCETVPAASYFDLDALLRDQDSPQSLFNDDMYHLSPQGNALTAIALSKYIAALAAGLNKTRRTQDFVASTMQTTIAVVRTLHDALPSSSPEGLRHNLEAALSTLMGAVRINRQVSDSPAWSFIEITNKCNLNCSTCNTQLSKRPRGTMSPEMFEAVVTRLQGMHVSGGALHTVGEPLMHPQLDELLEIARKKDFAISLSSNGQLTSRLENVLTRNAGHVREVRFSVDAATPETYAEIRRGGTIERVWDSMNAILAHNAKGVTPCSIKTNFIVSDTNKDELELFFERAGRFMSPWDMNFNLPNSLSPDPTFLREIIPFHNLFYPTPSRCQLPFKHIAITFDGMISLCCRDYDGELIIGSLLEDEPAEVWHGPKATAIRKSLLGEGRLPQMCANCTSVAGGGICTSFIQTAHAMQLKDIGNRLWSVLAAINANPEDQKLVAQVCKSALS